MKKLLILFVAMMIAANVIGQEVSKDSVNVKIEPIKTYNDSLTEISNEWLGQIELDLSLKQRYKLYPTENLYNFIKLDTKTGKIWQVQWNLNSSKEGTWVINSDDLTSWLGGHGSNSFELYPTQNMYQFILLDKTDGRTWHVQWGTGGDKERWIRRIY